MRITISGTKTEMAAVLGSLDLDAQQLIQILVNNKMIERSEQVDNPKLNQVLEEVAWDTIYLMHLILEHAGEEQENDRGRFLTQEQIEGFGIKERSASSRVGGTKRVCNRLDLDDILFIRKGKKTGIKRYYLAADAIASVQQFLENNDEAYHQFLDEEELEFPEAE